jgi:hypothetical protein
MSIETKIIYNTESEKTIIEQNIKSITDNFKNGKDKEPLNNLDNLLTKFVDFIQKNKLSLKINNINYSSINTDFFNTLKSSILEKRNEEYLEKLKIKDVTLFGIHFDNTDNKTNVNYYLKNDNCLIIYNENFSQYNNKSDCSAGGGNGFLRQYRSDSNNGCSTQNRTDDGVVAHIYGIPTGTFDKADDTIKYQDSMNDSILQIIECINKNPKIKYVIWCIQKIKDNDYKKYNMTKPDDKYASEDLDTKTITLGLGIFGNCNKSVKAVKYISDILFKIFKTRKYYFSKPFTPPTSNDEHTYFNKYFETTYKLEPDTIVAPVK